MSRGKSREEDDLKRQVDELKEENAKLKEVMLLMDVADLKDWSCANCPRYAKVKSAKQECIFDDCLVNYMERERGKVAAKEAANIAENKLLRKMLEEAIEGSRQARDTLNHMFVNYSEDIKLLERK